MGDWGNVQQGLVSGFQVGRSTGGKMSGLGMALSKVADRLKEQRVLGQEMAQKQNLLGYEGLIKGTIAPAQTEEEGTFNVPGVGNVKSVDQVKAVVNPTTGQVEYTVPKKSVFKPQEHPEITKTTALGIISDPVKAEQLKMTYPDVYSLVESVAQGSTKTTPTFQPPKATPTGKRVNVIAPDGSRGDIPESQLQEALKSGFKRLP